MKRRFFTSRHACGLGVVLALHGLALAWLLDHRLSQAGVEQNTVFVDFVATPPPPPQAPKPAPVKLVKPREVVAPAPVQLIAQGPLVSAAEPVVVAPPPPSPRPVLASPAPAAGPAGPVTLGGELSLACPERTPPQYPAMSRRQGEQGRVVLRVELDEQGLVTAVRVLQSSGASRLDNTAVEAVRKWRCNPARRDGAAVKAVALQPFDFVLEGR